MRSTLTTLLGTSLLLFLVVSFITGSTSHSHNFYSKSTSKHGVHDLAFFVKGIRVKESVAGPMEGSPSGLVVRQLSNKRQVLNMIYNGVPSYLRPEEGGPLGAWSRGLEEASPVRVDQDGLQLRECGVLKGREEVAQFVEGFDEAATLAQGEAGADNRSNTSFVRVSGQHELPLYLQPLLKFRELKHKCFELKRQIRRKAKARIASRQHAHDGNQTHSPKRLRRSVTNIFSLPNTKWCGEGHSASSYSELGGLYATDSCCRQHDMHCPYFIQSFERKYGYLHFGLGTISHCACDRRFKSCLKQTGTGAADVVGKVFFGIVKSQCFNFRAKKVCKKRGFWRCFRWGYEKQAVIGNSVLWN